MFEISTREARRISLHAQGFGDPPKKGSVTSKDFKRVMSKMNVIQLDSVQAVCRSHYLPMYSRLGLYEREDLDHWLWHSGKTFETWSHEASVVQVELEPSLRWMKRQARKGVTWAGLHKMAKQKSGYIAGVLAEVQQNGPINASSLRDPRPRKGQWWDGRSDGTRALDWLFRTGEVGIRRTSNFNRMYEPFSNLIPEKIRHETTPVDDEAHRDLLEIAGRSHGIGTASDLADYFRMKISDVRPRLEELVEDRKLLLAEVQGWTEPAYLHPKFRNVDRVKARALLSPFDPVVWCRPRTERIFDFKYRLEIYVPEKKREFGYYVLPFLLGDELVGRVDLKADRSSSQLIVKGSFIEKTANPDRVAQQLSIELNRLKKFLGLKEIVVRRRGNLSTKLINARTTS